MGDSAIKIRPLPSRNPDPATAKAHHIGSPPTAFRNPWPSFKEHTKWDAIKLRFGSNEEKNFVPVPEGPNGSRSDALVKVVKPHWGVNEEAKLRATWIGHASWLVELPTADDAGRGIRILFDPVFSERTSPFTFLGPKRYTPTPCSLDELPDPDVICISHNHYDHLDFDVVNRLYTKLKGRLRIFTGLGTKGWFVQHLGCSDEDVIELDWWDSCEVNVADRGIMQLTCCPTQHFSGRTLSDGGTALWCSFAVEGSGKKLYFAGDTGYQASDSAIPCPVFKQLGESIGPFDLALLPIGLYSPPSFAASVHVHPEQTLQIHHDIRSRLSIGMHYGTVRGGLSAVYEPVTDPPRRWREAAQKEGLWCGGGVEGDGAPVAISRSGVGLCHVGETVAV